MELNWHVGLVDESRKMEDGRWWHSRLTERQDRYTHIHLDLAIMSGGRRYV